VFCKKVRTQEARSLDSVMVGSGCHWCISIPLSQHAEVTAITLQIAVTQHIKELVICSDSKSEFVLHSATQRFNALVSE